MRFTKATTILILTLVSQQSTGFTTTPTRSSISTTSKLFAVEKDDDPKEIFMKSVTSFVATVTIGMSAAAAVGVSSVGAAGIGIGMDGLAFVSSSVPDYHQVVSKSMSTTSIVTAVGAPKIGGGGDFETLDFSMPSYDAASGSSSTGASSSASSGGSLNFANPFGESSSSDDKGGVAVEDKSDTAAEKAAAKETEKAKIKADREKQKAEADAAAAQKKKEREAEQAAAKQKAEEQAVKVKADEEEKAAKEAEKAKVKADREKQKAEADAAAAAIAAKKAEAKKEETPAAAPAATPPAVDAPTFKAPDVDLSDIKMPKFSMPKVDVPKIDTSKVNIPKFEAPKVDIPKFDAPKVDLPKFQAPPSPKTSSQSYNFDGDFSAPVSARKEDVPEVPVEPQEIRDDRARAAAEKANKKQDELEVCLILYTRYDLIHSFHLNISVNCAGTSSQI